MSKHGAADAKEDAGAFSETGEQWRPFAVNWRHVHRCAKFGIAEFFRGETIHKTKKKIR